MTIGIVEAGVAIIIGIAALLFGYKTLGKKADESEEAGGGGGGGAGGGGGSYATTPTPSTTPHQEPGDAPATPGAGPVNDGPSTNCLLAGQTIDSYDGTILIYHSPNGEVGTLTYAELCPSDKTLADAWIAAHGGQVIGGGDTPANGGVPTSGNNGGTANYWVVGQIVDSNKFAAPGTSWSGGYWVNCPSGHKCIVDSNGNIDPEWGQNGFADLANLPKGTRIGDMEVFDGKFYPIGTYGQTGATPTPGPTPTPYTPPTFQSDADKAKAAGATPVPAGTPGNTIVYVNLYSSPKLMSLTQPSISGWGTLSVDSAKSYGCVSV